MGLFQRLGGVIRHQINNLITEPEDPEQVLEQMVMAMEQQVIEMRRALAEAIATYKRTERQIKTYQTEIEKWYERAQLALEKDNEILARDALMRRQSYQTNLKTLEIELNQQRTLIQTLKRNLLDLEKKFLDIKNKKNLYLARLRSAAANQKFQEMTNALKNGNIVDIFDKIDAKIIELDAQSSALSDPIEEKFMSLEEYQNIDQQLQEMKLKRLESTHDQ